MKRLKCFKGMTEGRKMFLTVMIIFIAYSAVFIIFEDYDRQGVNPLDSPLDWHLLWFSLAVALVLGLLLHHYARRVDNRISREQAAKQNDTRREMTQNIAHELKTPVASILGFTETLLDNPDLDAATQRQFIERSHAQAQRLTALLQDISILNRMDYATDVLDIRPVDLTQLVADIVEETAIPLRNKHMTLENCLPENIKVEGNTSLLYSIFRNLIDNAISYSGEGTSIRMEARNMGDHWQFTFADNGSGVPTQHLERIFERFYRIDKGRSRTMGGTGLGLAIVKNAIQTHGGIITAYNQLHGGLCFHFTLQKKFPKEKK